MTTSGSPELPNLQIPRDENDPRYAASFDAGGGIEEFENAKTFFSDFGFVVFRNVFSDTECNLTRDAMWSIVEKNNEGFSRDDPHTWNAFKAAGKYGLSMRGPCFDPQLVSNRQNPRLAKCLEYTVGAIAGEDLMVSHDRYTIYRATKLELEGCQDVDGKTFSTGRKNVHLDLNPWWWEESSHCVLDGVESLMYKDNQDLIKENNLVVKSMGVHVQCVLNFADNLDEDGGTILVPGFHKYVTTWNAENLHLKRPLPWLEFKLEQDERPLLDKAQRVPMRQGSVLIWNQTMVHGTAPNESSRCRLAQFLKAFSRSQSFRFSLPTSIIPLPLPPTTTASSSPSQADKPTSQRLIRRAQLIRSCLEENGCLDLVTPLGESLFGLDSLVC